MKKILFIINCFIGISIASAQAPTFQWAKDMSGTSYAYGNAIKTDASGNLYTVGGFAGTVDFDPGIGTYTLSSGGLNPDIFILKLDASGNFVWAQSIGASGSDEGYGISVDTFGDICATGKFSGTPDFDPGVGTYYLTSNGNQDIFVLKLNASGNFIWAKNMGGTGNDRAYSITTDASGNIYTTGNFNGTADFDPNASTFTISTGGFDDVFVSKLDVNGNFVWAKNMGGNLADFANSITTDALGNLYIAGSFDGTADFDPSAGTYTLATNGSLDGFVCKMDALGDLIWVKQIGSTSGDGSKSVIVDASGNVYTTGIFQGTVDFDPSVTTSYTLNSAGFYDVFVLKLDASGNFVWAQNMGGSSDDISNSIELDALGNVYTTGYFQSTADFDPSVVSYNLTSNGSTDIFVSKLNNMGNFSWALNLGGSSNDFAGSIEVDASGSIYTTGGFNSTVDFDPSATTLTLSSNNGYGVFVHTMSQTLCIPPATPTNNTTLANQTICANMASTLSAVSNTATINWYATATSTAALGTGTNYITPTLTAGTYTYYAEAQTCAPSATRTAVTITVNALPIISVNSGAICVGKSFTMVPSGANSYTFSSGSAIVTPTASTFYNVTGTATNGCIGSNTATSNVTVNALPTINAISNTSLLCIGQTASLTASGANTFTWNTNVTTTVIAVSPTVTTTYTVTGTNSNGCSNSVIITQSVSSCTGLALLNEIETSLIKLYPNPSNGNINIEAEIGTDIIITNTFGQLIYNEKSVSKTTPIDLQSFKNGLYFVRLQKDKTSKIVKVIKE